MAINGFIPTHCAHYGCECSRKEIGLPPIKRDAFWTQLMIAIGLEARYQRMMARLWTRPISRKDWIGMFQRSN